MIPLYFSIKQGVQFSMTSVTPRNLILFLNPIRIKLWTRIHSLLIHFLKESGIKRQANAQASGDIITLFETGTTGWREWMREMLRNVMSSPECFMGLKYRV